MRANRFNYPNLGLRGGFGRLVQDAFQGLDGFGSVFANTASGDPHAKADLFEDEHHYFVALELPGVSKSDLHVELVDGDLNVSATYSRETANGRKNTPFKHSIALPDQVDTESVRAKLEDGILTITVPKAEAAKPHSITIE